MAKPLSKFAIVLVIVAVVGLVLAGPLLGLPFQVVAYNATVRTTTYNYQGWQGAGNPAYGGADPGQLLDQTDYIASWSYNLLGQRVTVQGGVVVPSTSLCYVNNWAYRVEIYVPGETPISGWNLELPHNQPIANYPAPSSFPDPNGQSGSGTLFTEPVPGNDLPASVAGVGGTVMAPAVYWDMLSPDGSTIIPQGSVIRSEFWVGFFCSVLVGSGGTGWHLLAWDEARVHTGIGTVNWDRAPALYALGETATCTWTIGYVSDPQRGLGWAMSITSSGQGNQVVATNPSLSTLNGALSYKVKAADLAGSRNKLICDLRNNLFAKDFAITAVVWCTNCGPSLSVTGVSPQTPKQGQPVTVSWTDAPNPTTLRKITGIEIIWGWGGPQNDVNISGNATSYTFLATQAGFLNFAVAAWDAGGNSSGFTNLKISVNPQEANGGLGGGGPGGGMASLIAAIVLLVVGVVLVYLVFRNQIPIEWLKWIVLVVGVVMIIFGGWLLIVWIAANLPTLPAGLVIA